MKLIGMLLMGLSTASYAGGITAGGGGTLPAEPAGAEAVREIVQNAKRDLKLFVKYQQWGFKKGEDALEDKLYGEATTLLDVLESTDMAIEMNEPCYDANKVPVDGSIYASKPNAICISAFTIGPKVVAERARIETLALILHELSHVMGTTEEEAISLQKNAAYFLKNTSDETSETRMDALRLSAEKLTTRLRTLIEKFDEMSSDDVANHLNEITMAESDFFKDAVAMPYSIYDRPEYDFATVQADRLRLAQWYATASSNAPDANYARELMDKALSGKESVSYAEFDKSRSEGSVIENIFDQELMVRIHTATELKAALKPLLDYYMEQSRRVWDLSYGRKLSKQRLPGTQEIDFWSGFAGNYEVVAHECNTGANHAEELRSLSVHTGENGKLYLKRRWASSSAEDGLYDGAMHISAGLVTIGGMQDAPVRTAEFGDRWKGPWGLTIWTLSRNGDGYRFTTRETFRSGDSDSVTDCTFELLKPE